MPRGVRRDDHIATVENTVEEKVRMRFGRGEDYLLAIQVRVDTPYKARHGAIGESWDVLAERLNQHPDFHMRPIKGTTAKARFDTIVAHHRLWMERANVEKCGDIDSPYRITMTELIKEIDNYLKSNIKLIVNEADSHQEDMNVEESRSSSRLGKRQATPDAFDIEPEAREVFMLPRAIGIEQTQIQPGDSSETQEPQVTEASETFATLEEPVPDLLTVKQAMGELLKMQHVFAARSGEIRVVDIEKMNEARLREEEEKTRQRSFELQIEIQRTKRRQLELEFERDERRKDREEQAKLIANLLQHFEPKKC
ncbi:uncharacterized protein PHALS_11634 [Plasmopara halstedii]|uniref:Uncharacterized protein n=1 Tax=Plasmopara halstedii TaxID=4781 RepID=A0A0P1AKS8_PLAHL|nr:uncharacterized protein PHALS_11634 [Plasmopara halstedii]CEG41277.1 hypothetical protein PHALS_11634 [Plasmopara halstedii]|eukprot:XP_024577646.1 hypothetical protein PHALS_11634 [Plasmopara halstedii]